jgi:superoxide dismutase
LLKEKLENLLIPVTGTLLVYAHDHNNKPYVEKLKKLRKKSEKTTPEELLERSKSLIIKLKKQFNNQATDEKEKPEFKEDHISAYGITSEMVEELAETRRKYRKTWSLISELLYTKKKSKKKVISLVKQNENLLKNKIDLILTIYEKREPAFYNAYQNARIIETVVPVENDAKNANLTTSV